MKILKVIKTFVAIMVMNFGCSFFFAGLSDVGYKLLFYGNLKACNPSIAVKCFIIYFIASTLLALEIVLLYNVNRKLWDSIDAKRDEFKLFKLIPNIKLLASFYLDFRDCLFHVEM